MAHSTVGVPGLVACRAARARCAVANALGSGLVESPALMAFLPAICRRLLGEELQIPSVRTWWCGDRNRSQYRAGPIWNGWSSARPFRRDIADAGACRVAGTARSAASWPSEIKAAPGKFVAQELIVRSTAPVWSDGALKPGHIALARSSAVARAIPIRSCPVRWPTSARRQPDLGEIAVCRARQQRRLGAGRRARWRR